MITAGIVVFALAAGAVLLAMGYFRRFRMTRPPLGVITLGDVVFMLAAIVLVPYLYLRLPGWLVAALLALGAFGLLQILAEPVLAAPRLSWVFAAVVVAADLLVARQAGTASASYLAVNDVALLLIVIAVTNVWAQSGLRARDLAILGGTLAVYDVIATSLLPLTGDLISRLAGLPFTPVAAWPTGDGGWVGIGLGDLLLAAAGPLVFRKAFGPSAGNLAAALALGAVAMPLLLLVNGRLPGVFPVMILLGPLLAAQYLCWIRVRGRERTTAAYLAEGDGVVG